MIKRSENIFKILAREAKGLSLGCNCRRLYHASSRHRAMVELLATVSGAEVSVWRPDAQVSHGGRGKAISTETRCKT
jgi:hypothetical protein